MSERDDVAGGPPLLPELSDAPSGAPTPDPTPQPARAPEDVESVWLALLRNRLIIGGASVVVLLVLTALVLIAIGRGDGPIDTETVSGAETPDAGPDSGSDGVTATLRTTISMRNGPGPEFQSLGTIPRNARVSVVGRNEDSTWLQIVWPPGSTLRGWISVAFAEVEGDVGALAIAGPGPGPSIDVPTSSGPTFFTPVFIATATVPVAATPEPTEEDEPTPRPTRTPRPANTPTFVPPPPTVTIPLQ